jgi:uncharacterized protein YgiM (DUF1202 family)
MQQLKDFIIKYKRYIGAAVIFVVLVLILVNCTGPKNGNSDTQAGTEISGTQATEYQLEGKLKKDADPELVELIKNYYTAYAAGDMESLEPLAQPLSDNEKSYIGTFSDYYESFDNIVCYSMPGATDDSYLVSVCYDLKFYEVDTPAPGMDFFYVERDGKGNLYINNVYSSYNFNFLDEELDANLYSLILNYEKSDDVVALQQQVQAKYDEAVASDEKLANMVGGTLRSAMTKWRDSVAATQDTEDATDVTPATTEETQKTENTESKDDSKDNTESKDDSKKDDKKADDNKSDDSKKESGTVKTKDICRVRAKASTDSEMIGTVNKGVKLKKIGTEGDWTKVKFQGQTGYIKTEFLKKVSSKSSDSSDTGMVKTKDICNVRAKASADAELLGKVDVGVKLKKLGTSGDWTKVKFQGKTGYIKSNLLKKVKKS